MDNITKLFSEETFQEAEKRNQKSIDNENIKHKALTSLVGRVEGIFGHVVDMKIKNFQAVPKLRKWKAVI